MKSVVETWTCDKCSKAERSGFGWMSVKWYEQFRSDPFTIELCPDCFGAFRKWVKR